MLVNRARSACLALIVPALWLVFAIYNENRYLDPDTGRFYLILVVLRATMFGAIYALCYGVLAHRDAVVAFLARNRRDSVRCAALFAFLAIYYLIWLLGLWPGLLMTDTLASIRRLESLHIDNWFSYLHPLLWLGLYQVWPNVAVIGLFQIVITAALLVYIAATLNRIGGITIAALAVGLSLVSVPIIVNSILYTRDTVFGVVHMALAIYLFNKVRRRSIGAV